MRLSEIKKRKQGYYTNRKTRQQSIDRSFGSKQAIRYYIERIYQGIPKRQKQYISEEYDIQRTIDTMVNSIMYMQGQKINPYLAFKSIIENQKRNGYIGTKEYIYKEFRTQEPELYNKYNSYVYRLGYSAMQWFMDKGNVETKNSMVTVDVSLPDKYSGRVFYDTLHLEFDMSGGFFVNCYMG